MFIQQAFFDGLSFVFSSWFLFIYLFVCLVVFFWEGYLLKRRRKLSDYCESVPVMKLYVCVRRSS